MNITAFNRDIVPYLSSNVITTEGSIYQGQDMGHKQL